MPGRNININLPNSNATMDGNGGGSPPACYPVIGVTSAANKTTVNNSMKRVSNYTTCNPSGGSTLQGIAAEDNIINGTSPFDGTTNTPNFPIPGGPCPPGATGGQNCLNYVAYLQGLVSHLSAVGGPAACVGLKPLALP
jgi:hypothetical protein